MPRASNASTRTSRTVSRTTEEGSITKASTDSAKGRKSARRIVNDSYVCLTKETSRLGFYRQEQGSTVLRSLGQVLQSHHPDLLDSWQLFFSGTASLTERDPLGHRIGWFHDLRSEMVKCGCWHTLDHKVWLSLNAYHARDRFKHDPECDTAFEMIQIKQWIEFQLQSGNWYSADGPECSIAEDGTVVGPVLCLNASEDMSFVGGALYAQGVRTAPQQAWAQTPGLLQTPQPFDAGVPGPEVPLLRAIRLIPYWTRGSPAGFFDNVAKLSRGEREFLRL